MSRALADHDADDATLAARKEAAYIARDRAALDAACALGRAMRRVRPGVYAAPAALFLSPALLAAGASHVVVNVEQTDDRRLAFDRVRLAKIARVLRRRRDVTIELDVFELRPLRIRWNGGRGGLDLYADQVALSPRHRDRVHRFVVPSLDVPREHAITRAA